VVDAALPPSLLKAATAAFHVDAPFWAEHQYPTPSFFSYCLALGDDGKGVGGTANRKKGTGKRAQRCGGGGGGAGAGGGLIGQLAAVVKEHAASLLPTGATVTDVEWWAHARDPEFGGHQLHFDLDEKALLESGAIRSPAVSAVLYLQAGGGAPTVVTDESITDATTSESVTATTAVRVSPRSNRLLLFDGSLLHGVPPIATPTDGDADGVGADADARITLMFGLWCGPPVGSDPPAWSRRGRHGVFEGLGPNMPHPPHKSASGRQASSPRWPVELLRPALLDDDDASHRCTAVEGPLAVIAPVWTAIASKRKGGSAKRGKRRKVDNQPASDTGPYVGKWFVQAPSEIRDEALNARDWVLRQDDAESDEDEFVDAAELARLRAL
jgi:hypothetical protein